MSKVYAGASMSIDGYIAGPGESGFEHLFAWMGNGEVDLPTTNPDIKVRVTEASAPVFRGYLEETGALVVGRKLFDLTNGWGGIHTLGHHTFVVTHSVPEGWEDAEHYTFVTEGGVPAAVEQAKAHAGERNVAVNGGEIASQALDARLVDELGIDLVPVVLGSGIPLLPNLTSTPVVLDDPEVIQGTRVTHLRYRVRYS